AHPCVLLRRFSPFGRFPYTSLFRSLGARMRHGVPVLVVHLSRVPEILAGDVRDAVLCRAFRQPPLPQGFHFRAAREQGRAPAARSEEHTSELQSRENIVCRLLLDKK